MMRREPVSNSGTQFGTKFSDSGPENLRFGKLSVDADKARVNACLAAVTSAGTGDGSALNSYFTQQRCDLDAPREQPCGAGF